MKVSDAIKWGIKGNLRIIYSKIVFGDTSVGKNYCIKKYVNKTIKKYKAMPDDSVPFKSTEKIPVWMFWWQGQESMPELVKLCSESVKRNLPENMELHLVSKDNIEKYVELSETVQKKFRENKISITHYSDILRFSLLKKYGGMWIDATYFVIRPIPKELFQNQKIFTQRMSVQNNRRNNAYIWNRWAGNLIFLPKESKLAGFMLEAFEEYWKTNDELIEYYLIDQLIRIAYDEFDDIHKLLESCSENNCQVHGLVTIVNDLFDSQKWEQLTADTTFFKLTLKRDYKKTTEDGRLTFYGYMCQKIEDED